MLPFPQFLFRSRFKPAPGSSVQIASSTDRDDARRRQLLLIALHDVLHKQGIPTSWIGAEASASLIARQTRGMHLRLVVRHWHPALPLHFVALQKSIRARILRLDPLCSDWLTGLSWKFEPMDDTMCPELPAPEFWSRSHARAATGTPSQRALHATSDVLRERDAAFRVRATGHDDFKPTQPMIATPRR